MIDFTKKPEGIYQVETYPDGRFDVGIMLKSPFDRFIPVLNCNFGKLLRMMKSFDLIPLDRPDGEFVHKIFMDRFYGPLKKPSFL